MTRIVITEPLDLSPAQLARLRALAEVVEFGAPPATVHEWLTRCAGFSHVCSGKCGLTWKHPEGGRLGIFYLPAGTVVSHPFVNVAMISKDQLRAAQVTLGYAPGANRDAVAEWVMSMLLELFRGFAAAVNLDDPSRKLGRTRSLVEKRIVILGANGAVGSAVAARATAFRMEVVPFIRGMDLLASLAGAHAVVNCLSSLPENNNRLADEFFAAMAAGSFFVSMTNPSIWNIDALVAAVKSGHLGGAAIDVGNKGPGDVTAESYRALLSVERILATPQIAHFADVSARSANDMMVANIEASVAGRPMPHVWA